MNAGLCHGFDRIKGLCVPRLLPLNFYTSSSLLFFYTGFAFSYMLFLLTYIHGPTLSCTCFILNHRDLDFGMPVSDARIYVRISNLRENSARVWWSGITTTPAYEAMSVEELETFAVTARFENPLSSSSSQLAF